MSMHLAVVSIEGNYLADLGDLFLKCNYQVEKTATVRTGKQASRELTWKPDSEHVAKLAYFANGWTIIVDPEMVLSSGKIWLEYSKKWKTRILGWLCEGTSASYSLALYQAGKQRRHVVSVDGDVVLNEGKPLPEEEDMDWGEASDEKLIAIATRIGAAYDFPANREYTVFYLNEPQMNDEE